jgi:hypothetical protein
MSDRKKYATTNEKNCYCYVCKKWFHYMGIARHRVMHMRKNEYCKIGYTNGDILEWNIDKKEDKK